MSAVVILIGLSFHVRSGIAAGADPAQPRKIEVAAKRFAYSPSEITVKKGEPVILSLHSEDVTHGFTLKEMDLHTEIPRDTTSELSFTPSEAGDFIAHCSHFCGAGHGGMALTIHVTE